MEKYGHEVWKKQCSVRKGLLFVCGGMLFV